MSYPSQPPQPAARLQGQPPPTESMCTVTYSFAFLDKIWIARQGGALDICRYITKETEREILHYSDLADIELRKGSP